MLRATISGRIHEFAENATILHAVRFARVVLDTNNVDCCARVCHGPAAAAMKMLGTGAATNSLDDIERAHTILLCGTNTTNNAHAAVTRRGQGNRGAR